VLRLITTGLLLVALAFGSLIAEGADFFVSTSGVDANPGTLASPWRTIQKAVNTVIAGDKVNIRSGTYPERVTILGKEGTSNLLEYSQGMNPTRSDAELLLAISRTPVGIRFTYRKVAPELSFNVRRSQSLSSRGPSGLGELSLGGNQFGVDLPLNPAPQFIRLEVSQP
jgi:hypothetical protein